jgi:hypothetical protein
MKKMFLALFVLGYSIGVFAQSTPQISPPTSDKGMFYADLSPLFFASGGWGFALGYEKKYIQSGINFVGVKNLEGQ